MTKKRQHYVWQHYINNWANSKNQVYVVTREKEFLSNTENLAVEQYFYNVEYFSETDVDFIKKLFEIDEKGNALQKQNSKWIESFSNIFRLKDYLDKSQISTVEGNEFFLNALKDVEEDGISLLEQDFIPVLDRLMQKDVAFFNSEKNYFDLVFFLCFTYFRTKKMRERAIESVKGTELGNHVSDIVKRTWSFTKYIFTTNMSYGLITNKFHLILLENKTSVNFITCDQPVINTKANYETMDKVNDLELYFPVTPNISVLLTKSLTDEDEKFKSLKLDEVQKYNKMILKSYENQVYFTDSEQKKLILDVISYDKQ